MVIGYQPTKGLNVNKNTRVNLSHRRNKLGNNIDLFLIEIMQL